MTDSPGEERLHVYVPTEIKRALEDDERTQKEVVTEYLTPLADGLDSKAAFERRLDDLQEEDERLAQEIADRQEQRERVQEQIERVQEEYDAYLEEVGEYADQLDEILDGLVQSASKNVAAFTTELSDAARDEYGRNTKALRQQVVEDLRERARERNLALDDSRFRAFGQSTRTPAASADGGTEDNDSPLFDFHVEDDGGDSDE